MLRVVVLQVLFFVDMGTLRIPVYCLYCLKLFFYVKLMQIQLIRYLRHN